MTTYLFDKGTATQHDLLALAYDPTTVEGLVATGVGPGWHCLEVGAGNGSIARWLADRVDPSGSVLATDLIEGPGVVRHDVTRDPLPSKHFDLIHARLVLRHLPDRERVLARLVDALKPGGWLQLEEFDTSYGPVLAAPTPADAVLYERFLAAKDTVMTAAGVDRAWGSRAGAAMRATGLVDVESRPRVQQWDPDSPGLRLLSHTSAQLRDALVEAGMTDEELTRVRAVMADPGFRACSSVFYVVRGRR